MICHDLNMVLSPEVTKRFTCGKPSHPVAKACVELWENIEAWYFMYAAGPVFLRLFFNHDPGQLSGVLRSIGYLPGPSKSVILDGKYCTYIKKEASFILPACPAVDHNAKVRDASSDDNGEVVGVISALDIVQLGYFSGGLNTGTCPVKWSWQWYYFVWFGKLLKHRHLFIASCSCLLQKSFESMGFKRCREFWPLAIFEVMIRESHYWRGCRHIIHGNVVVVSNGWGAPWALHTDSTWPHLDLYREKARASERSCCVNFWVLLFLGQRFRTWEDLIDQAYPLLKHSWFK